RARPPTCGSTVPPARTALCRPPCRDGSGTGNRRPPAPAQSRAPRSGTTRLTRCTARRPARPTVRAAGPGCRARPAPRPPSGSLRGRGPLLWPSAGVLLHVEVDDDFPAAVGPEPRDVEHGEVAGLFEIDETLLVQL